MSFLQYIIRSFEPPESSLESSVFTLLVPAVLCYVERDNGPPRNWSRQWAQRATVGLRTAGLRFIIIILLLLGGGLGPALRG